MEATKTAPRSEGVELGLRAVRLLAMGAIAFALESFLDAYRLAALLMGAFAVELLAGKVGMRWDETGKRKTLAAALVVGRGFGLGVATALLVVAVAAVSGLAQVSIGAPNLVGLGLGLVVPFAQAARDELLFRGAPLALLRDRIPDRFALPFAALLGGAPLLLANDRSPAGIAIVVVTGLIFAVAWRLGKGMFLAWGAHAGWLFMLGAGTRGTLLDVSFGAGQLLPFVRAEGAIVWVALAVTIVASIGAIVWWRRSGEVPDESR